MLEPIVDKLEAGHLFIAVETAIVAVAAIVIVAIYKGLAEVVVNKFLKDKKNE